MSVVNRSADETRALSSRIHSLRLSNHLDDTHATLSATALQLCSVDRTRAVTLTHTYISPHHTVNDRTWFRAMVTRTCSVQSALQHACRVVFLVHARRATRPRRARRPRASRYVATVAVALRLAAAALAPVRGCVSCFQSRVRTGPGRSHQT